MHRCQVLRALQNNRITCIAGGLRRELGGAEKHYRVMRANKNVAVESVRCLLRSNRATAGKRKVHLPIPGKAARILRKK